MPSGVQHVRPRPPRRNPAMHACLLSVLAAAACAAARPASADVFFLDFLAPTQANQHNYSVADREAIRSLMAADYAPFGHSVVTTQPTGVAFSRIQINATTSFGGQSLTFSDCASS